MPNFISVKSELSAKVIAVQSELIPRVVKSSKGSIRCSSTLAGVKCNSLVSNYSTYWPNYGLNTNFTELLYIYMQF